MQGYRDRLRTGMSVHSADGHKLGKIVRLDPQSFVIEKGLFFPKDYLAGYDEVSGIDGDDVRLSIHKDELTRMGELVERQDDDRGAARAPVAGDREGVRVQAVEEELEAGKRVRQTGSVEVRKDVRTEEKQITVPVVREEVHVERHAVDRPAGAGDASFEGDTVRVPVHEEEIEVRKRPVVREEVRVSKTPRVEQRTASAEVRREEIDVDREGERRADRDPDLDRDPGGKKLI